MTFKWYDIEGNRYLLFYQLANSDYYRIGNTYYNLIKKYNDLRITVIARQYKSSGSGQSIIQILMLRNMEA